MGTPTAPTAVAVGLNGPGTSAPRRVRGCRRAAAVMARQGLKHPHHHSRRSSRTGAPSSAGGAHAPQPTAPRRVACPRCTRGTRFARPK
eukprot:4539909-Prymnesium_polylepis.1